MNLDNLVLEKINFGENLIQSLGDYSNLEGLSKLTRKIKQELAFLKKIYKSKAIKKEHLQCSNLTHFAALVSTLKKTENCQCVNKVFTSHYRKITVDIIYNNGLVWKKVIARNPKSLSQIGLGNGSYGVRSIIDQAKDYIECAKLYPCLFQIPKVIFEFVNGIGYNLAAKLESIGVQVEGERSEDLDLASEDLDDFSDDTSSDEASSDNDGNFSENDDLTGQPNPDLASKNVSGITKVNLDVSAMLAYCSSVTNGSASKYTFSVPVLAQQAKWEQSRPQKPILEEFFKGKKLYCCETAIRDFKNIVNTVGGPNEKIRAEEFIKKITILPDNATTKDTEESTDCSDIFSNVQYTPDKSLAIGGKIRQRSLIIFTFGDRIRAVTVTANEGFIRAAKQQGINFVVFLHESRALTEQKEMTKAQKLE